MKEFSLTQKMLTLWKEFFPLSVSDVTMALGDPLVNTTLAQMPKLQTNLAALGVVKALVVLFESPIIMLLHASNTLAKKEEAEKALWQFVLICCVFLTLILSILAVPVIFYWLATVVIGISVELAQTAHQIFLCLLLWPAAIAWRRYFQGILIAHGNLQIIARAGVLRLLVLAFCLLIGFYLGWQGALIAGLSMILGVLSETAVVTLYGWKHRKRFFQDDTTAKINNNITMKVNTTSESRMPSHIASHSLQNDLQQSYPSQTIKKPMSLGQIWKFYWPLAHSMVLVWGGRALLVVCLARAVDSSLALAIWPVTWALVLVFANATRMIQQVIIRNKHNFHPIDFILFAFGVGTALSAVLLFFSTTNIGRYFLGFFVGQDNALLTGVQQTLLYCSCVPIFVAIQNVLQGLLIGCEKTKAINQSTLIGIVFLITFSFAGINLGYLGAKAAALSMLFSMLVEVSTLSWRIPWKLYITRHFEWRHQITLKE